jgi:predicted DNA-binding ribbon-helix-helix protein
MIRQPKKGKSLLTRRSIYIWSRKSSGHVERPFWEALREIADVESLKLTELIARIDTNRYTPNLSSAIRLFVLDYYQRLSSGSSN